ncbi:MAG: glycoside hydrolase family 3 N-terminal domain-containing protein [Rikenellaceae bacterium]
MNKLLTILTFSLLVGCSEPQQPLSQVKLDPLMDTKNRAIVDSIYNKMTTEERVAQLQGIRPREIMVDGKISLDLCRKMIPNGIGHLSQFACMLDYTPNELRDMVRDIQNYLINETPSGIPAIFHEEAITGVAALGATTYPQQLGMSCTWNSDLMEKKTRLTAESMREVGSFMALSPNLDIIRTAVFNRGEEAMGEDSYLTSRLGVAFVDGLQGEDLTKGVAACAKHYLGYGGGSEVNETNEKVLFEEILMPYDAVVRVSGVKDVMTGYHQFRGIYSVFNKYLISDVLRDYLGFEGLLVSDYGAIAQLNVGNKNKGKEEFTQRAADAINAGCDMEFSSGVAFPYIPDAIAEGKLSQEQFETAVKRTLALKVRLGLFDKSVPLYKAEGDIDLNKPEYQQVAYDAAVQSVVLLKNDGTLPLSPKSGKIGLFGPNANSEWAMLGDYTYQSMHLFHQGKMVSFDSPRIYTLKDGMESVAKGAEINYSRACDWSMSHEAFLNVKSGEDRRFVREKVRKLYINLYESITDETSWSKAMKIARNSDVIVAAVGENVALCGEGRGRKGIGLAGDQGKLVEELISTGKPVVVVIFGGRLQVLSETVLEKAAAIVQAWYPGQEGGRAVADILFGVQNPSGKLTMSYMNEHKTVDVCYNRADEQVAKAIYPFGYGLSYTKYSYSDLAMPQQATTPNGEFPISFNVTNEGEVAGDEIVQLYVSPLDSTLPLKPIQLKGFERVSLQVGETKEVTFTLSPRLLAHYREDGKWEVTPAKYRFKVGASSTDIHLEGDITLEGKPFVSRNRDVYFSNSTIK